MSLGSGIILERLRREGRLDTVEVAEPDGTVDREGNPGFGVWQTIEARANQVDEEVLSAEGDRIRTNLRLTIPASEDPHPQQGWRVRWEGETYRVMWHRDVRSVLGEVAHVSVRCSFGELATGVGR